MLNKIKGGLFGVAIGDALGATTEFMSQVEIQEKYNYLTNIIGGGWLSLEPGEVTDDTQMTLCVLNAILSNPLNPINEMGNQFYNWYLSKPKDIGMTINQVCQLYKGNWFEAAKQVHYLSGEKSAGNGSLMRCLPIALMYTDNDFIEEITIKQSLLTHYSELAAEACFYHNKIASQLLNGNDLKETIVNEIKHNQYGVVLDGIPNCPPDGFVVNTYRWVLYALLNTNSFSEVVQYCANLGGDTDTIASIAGGLAGIYYGYDNIANEYKNSILIKNELYSFAQQIFDFRNQL